MADIIFRLNIASMLISKYITCRHIYKMYWNVFFVKKFVKRTQLLKSHIFLSSLKFENNRVSIKTRKTVVNSILPRTKMDVKHEKKVITIRQHKKLNTRKV